VTARVEAAPARAAARPRGPRSLRSPYHLLLGTTFALVAMGLVMILSASSVEAYKRYGSSFLFFNRQIVGAGLGLVAMFACARLDYRKLRGLAAPLLAVTIVLLVAVLIPGMGVTRGGSSRWLDLGPLTLQPSELAKLALVLFTAAVFDRKGGKIFDPHEFAVPLVPAVGIVSFLIMVQPDLGTTIIAASSAALVAYLAGARLRHLGLLFTFGGLAAVALSLSESYRRARLFSFVNPWADPMNTGYQTIQGQIALGSGGWFGVGLGASRQKWSYVPNAHTDFILAILGEELGLFGTLFVVALFAFFIYLGVRIAKRAPDRFGFLLAGGIIGWMGLQAIVNMGAVTGILPITGVPLPLISFGGSSLVFTMAAIGILLSIARRSASSAS
jgi:cell division protein FtsW